MGLPSHREEHNAALAGATDLLGGCPDVLGPAVEALDQHRGAEDPPNPYAWDALDGVLRGAEAVWRRVHLLQVADAEKLVAQEQVAPELGGSRLADQVAGLPEAELYIRDADRSAEQSSAAQEPVDAGPALGLLNVELVFPDSQMLYSRPERGLMEHSQPEKQPHAALLLLVEQ